MWMTMLAEAAKETPNFEEVIQGIIVMAMALLAMYGIPLLCFMIFMFFISLII